MDGDGPAPRRRRLDGTILFGGILSALLHALGIGLLLMTPTRLQPLEQTAYTVEVVDPEALGGELLAGPIGAPEPPASDEPAPAAPPEPEEVRVVEAEPADREAVPVATARPKPTVVATPRPLPKPTRTKVAKPATRTAVPKRTPKPAAKKPAPPKAPARPAAKVAAAPAKHATADGGGEDANLDDRLSAAIAGLEGARGDTRGRGGTDAAPTGPPGVGGEGPGGGGEVRGIEFVAYYSQMLARIKDRWTWVGERTDLRVTVRFSILPSGDIANLRLVERSGEATYDASVQRAIKSASPFAPPPEKYQRDFGDVELTFRPADLEVAG